MFRVGQMQEVDNLNPFIGQSLITTEILHLNYDYLVGYAPNGDPRPELADSWEVSDDGLTWTFKIHPGIKCHDGEPLTARDVAFTYMYVIDNELAAYTWNTSNMKEVVATDDATVVFHLSKPRADMLRTAVTIVPEHIWSKVPGDKVETYQVKLPLVGSGPVPGDRGEEGLVLGHGGQQGLLRGRAHDRRGHLRAVHESGHLGRWTSRAARSTWLSICRRRRSRPSRASPASPQAPLTGRTSTAWR